MTFGNFVAVVIAAAAIAGVIAFLRTRVFDVPTWPFKH